MTKTKVAIIGSGNIGTDLMIKVLRLSDTLEMAAMVGIDPASDGLARAARLGIPTTHDGVDGLIALDGFDDDRHRLRRDLGQGPPRERREARAPTASGSSTSRPPRSARSSSRRSTSTSTSTWGPTTSTWSRAAARPRFRSSRRSPRSPRSTTPRSSPRSPRKSAGPGTRANIDEFTETTSQAIESVGGAGPRQGDHRPEPGGAAADHARHRVLPDRRRRPRRRTQLRSTAMAERVAQYVPGYRLKQEVQFTPGRRRRTRAHPRSGRRGPGHAPRCRCSSKSRAPPTTCRHTPGISTS